MCSSSFVYVFIYFSIYCLLLIYLYMYIERERVTHTQKDLHIYIYTVHVHTHAIWYFSCPGMSPLLKKNSRQLISSFRSLQGEVLEALSQRHGAGIYVFCQTCKTWNIHQHPQPVLFCLKSLIPRIISYLHPNYQHMISSLCFGQRLKTRTIIYNNNYNCDCNSNCNYSWGCFEIQDPHFNHGLVFWKSCSPEWWLRLPPNHSETCSNKL